MTSDPSSAATPASGSLSSPSVPPRSIALPLWASRWWALLLVLAIAEVAALGVRTKRVASPQDWRRAAQYVREQFEPEDAITSAPGWTDPTLRLHLGDKISPKIVGRSDLSSFERLWVLTVRGARADDAPAREPDQQQAFGRVIVQRYDFGPSPEVLDLVDSLPQAKVSVQRRGREQPCSWNARASGHARGGLFFGPVFSRQRFECNRRVAWNHVGVTMLEDLDLKPRRCIWQHPTGKEPVSVTYEDVHLGTHVVLYGGLYHMHEREREGADVHVRVLIDGKPVEQLVHRDGDGFKRWVVNTTTGRAADAPMRGDLRIEVTSSPNRRRSFCWSGSIRDAVRREAP